jgi:hypothetical protein
MAGITSTVCKEGNINTLLGPPDAGKSNLASLFAQWAIEINFHVFTTMHYFKPDRVDEAILRGKLRKLPGGKPYHKVPSELHTVMSLGELFLGILNPNLEGFPKLTVIDEAVLYASSKSANSNKAKTMEQLATLIRHLGSALILITQVKGGLTPALREHIVTYEIRIELRGQQRYWTVGYRTPVRDEFEEEHIQFPIIQRVFSLPMTIYPLDSKYMPRFVFDLDLEEAFNRLGKYDSLEVLDHGRAEIENLIEEWQLRKDKKEGREMGEDPKTKQKVTNLVNKIMKQKKISRSNAFIEAGQEMKRSRYWVESRYIR